MTSFLLKIIACVTMFIDHIGYVVFGKTSYFNYIGRLAFPIFAFQISEGYLHTKNLKKYLIRIGTFAIISQIPFLLFKNSINPVNLNLFKMPLNVFFTLFLGLIAIICYDKINLKPILDLKILKIKLIPIILVAGIACLAEFFNVDYGYFGVLVTFFFYLFKESKVLTTLGFSALVAIKFFSPLIKYNFYFVHMYLFVFTLLAIVPILFYNKKQGKKIKYFLYFFYPAHLLLFYFLNTYFSILRALKKYLYPFFKNILIFLLFHAKLFIS